LEFFETRTEALGNFLQLFEMDRSEGAGFESERATAGKPYPELAIGGADPLRTKLAALVAFV
jgi:hypothetical protein